MQYTTLVSGLSALILSHTAAAAVVRSGDACKSSPHSAFAALSHWPAAQSFCSSASFAVASPVTATVTTTSIAEPSGLASISAFETVTFTETSTAVATSALLPKARRGKCRKPSATKPALSGPSSTNESPIIQSSVSASYDALFSNLISSPSSVAQSVCSCYIEAPVTVTATSTVVVSGVATAAVQSAGVVTVTTTIIVSDTSSSTSESSTIGSSTSTGTSTSESTSASSTSTEAPASTGTTMASACSAIGPTYTTDNSLVFSVACSSLYLADETNTISQSELPDLEACIDACAETSGCSYLLYVESESYGAARQCYLLGSDIGFGTGYDGIATAQLIAG